MDNQSNCHTCHSIQNKLPWNTVSNHECDHEKSLAKTCNSMSTGFEELFDIEALFEKHEISMCSMTDMMIIDKSIDEEADGIPRWVYNIILWTVYLSPILSMVDLSFSETLDSTSLKATEEKCGCSEVNSTVWKEELCSPGGRFSERFLRLAVRGSSPQNSLELGDQAIHFLDVGHGHAETPGVRAYVAVLYSNSGGNSDKTGEHKDSSTSHRLSGRFVVHHLFPCGSRACQTVLKAVNGFDWSLFGLKLVAEDFVASPDEAVLYRPFDSTLCLECMIRLELAEGGCDKVVKISPQVYNYAHTGLSGSCSSVYIYKQDGSSEVIDALFDAMTSLKCKLPHLFFNERELTLANYVEPLASAVDKAWHLSKRYLNTYTVSVFSRPPHPLPCQNGKIPCDPVSQAETSFSSMETWKKPCTDA